jgi:hypothetical protein
MLVGRNSFLVAPSVISISESICPSPLRSMSTLLVLNVGDFATIRYHTDYLESDYLELAACFNGLSVLATMEEGHCFYNWVEI